MDFHSTVSLFDTPVPNHDTTEENLSNARLELLFVLGIGGVISDHEERSSHSNTPWSTASPSQIPALIVLPSTTSDTSAIMKICSQRRIPVTIFGGGTSFGGALTSTRQGICIDFRRMNRIIDIHRDDMDVRVQPAVEWQDLNVELASKGLFFPPDPGPGATIGGMIAMSCSGTNAYRHGTMKDWVISLTVVLADGTIVKTRHRPRKSAAGYDLTRLMIGSEGTLGLVTEAVLKVTSAPENIHVAIATFPSTQAAIKTATTLVRSCLLIDALEFIDKSSMRAINRSGLSSKAWLESATLFLKFSGSSLVVQDQIEKTRDAAKQNGCATFELSAEQAQIDILWGARKSVLKSFYTTRKEPTDLVMHADTAVPISRLADMIEETQQTVSDAGFTSSIVGHVGDGNFHTAILCSNTEKEAVDKIFQGIQRRAIEFEGTITGEHGVGLKLRDMLVYEVGPSGVDMMRKIKLALDPLCLLNCDKVLQIEAGY